ncbi:HupE/UreJ family protein [Paenibacillus alkalitolerans]|uniref:HupE/UreJ family protein n=1 Tax=Paenibacillus alkalitolerans TaxID=2799335 RepID=UPI0018F57E6A|nr:HupE/UreJ family protein [Paenibacillus alkalitolerans]
MQLRMAVLPVVAAWMILMCGLPAAEAHFSSTGYSDISIGEKTLEYNLFLAEHDIAEAMPAVDANKDGAVTDGELGQSSSELEKFVNNYVIITGDGKLAEPELKNAQMAERAKMRMVELDIVFEFAEPVQLYQLQYAVFFDGLAEDHRSFATIRLGDQAVEQVLNRSNNIIQIKGIGGAEGSGAAVGGGGERSSWLAVARDYTAMGMEHIWSGIDHLLFVFGLIAVERDKRALLKLLTAFTVGHSITLVLASLELASVSPLLVEPLIALSIVYVAVENVFAKKNKERRWQIAMLFGLIHGFGFAELLQGTLSNGNVALPLLSFNLGVELGQLAVVAAVLPMLWALRRWTSWTSRPYWTYATSGTIGALGLFWFIERVAGM